MNKAINHIHIGNLVDKPVFLVINIITRCFTLNHTRLFIDNLDIAEVIVTIFSTDFMQFIRTVIA